jgi:hypothetical protein
MSLEYYDRPCAVVGLTSYRYRGAYGWVMIGARDTAEALREAARSIEGKADPHRLEVWNEERGIYVAWYLA